MSRPPEPAQLDDWIAIEPDGAITAFSGKVELGTGVRTALAQIVAEELDVPLERVRLVMGDTARTPDEGYTAGSMTLQTSGVALRHAAAEARQALLEAATDRLDAMLDELSVQDGVIVVTRRPERRVAYAELMGGRRFNRVVSGTAPLKPPAAHRVVGASRQRVDLPAKLTGTPTYVTDVRRPGMRHARVLPPPNVGARLIAVDTDSVAGLPGRVQVVVRGSFVAVVADREEQAIHAASRLQARWQPGPPLPPQPELMNVLRDLPAETQVVADDGAVEAALQGAARRVQAAYAQPYHLHASIGPACAVAEKHGDYYTVWSSSQGPYPLRGALAELLNVPPERIHVLHVEGPGGYGHNGSDDAAAMALLLAEAVGGAVRLQWSRAMDFAWEPKAAAMRIEVQAALDEAGAIAAWDYHAWTPTHTARPRRASQLLAAQWQASQPPAPSPRGYGGGDRNALTSYTLPAQRVTMHWLAHSPLHTSSFRALGGTANTFANESFMDELAAAAGADPVEFRLRHLADARLRSVLEAAAERAGWPGPGLGVACAHYKNAGAYVATVAQVAVEPGTGHVRVERLVVAQDCGLIVNPDGVRSQLEGNSLQALSRCLKEEVAFDSGGVTSLDWEAYPILTFSETPEVECVLLNRPDQPALGVGEPATVTVAPAVANAIYAASGARVRQVPFTPARVRAALP